MVRLVQDKIENLTMPSGAVIEVNTAASGGMAEEMFDENGELSKPVSSVLAYQIRSWDYEGDNGKVAEINSENVRHLPVEDFNELAAKIMPQLNVVATVQVATAEKKG